MQFFIFISVKHITSTLRSEKSVTYVIWY